MKYNSAMERSELISSLWCHVLRGRIQARRASVTWFNCNSLEKAPLQGRDTDQWLGLGAGVACKGLWGDVSGEIKLFYILMCFKAVCAHRLPTNKSELHCILVISQFIWLKTKFREGERSSHGDFQFENIKKDRQHFIPTHACWVLRDKKQLKARGFPSFLLIIWLNAGLVLFISTL